MSEYLPTEPGTQMQFTVRMRRRPCWRCRTYRRLLGRKHWNCQPLPKLTYLDLP